MLTTVILDGPLGAEFGRSWQLSVNSPREALALVNANKPGVFAWIRRNLATYESYKVICEYENGETEELDTETYSVIQCKPVCIRFVPVVTGSGNTAKIVIGAILVIVGVYTEQGWLVKIGVGLMLSGVIGALTAQPGKRRNDQSSAETLNSHYFDGAVNTTGQGRPVPLIYGRVLVGSHTISAGISVDQLK